MRQWITLICLASFFVGQYGKIVSYWHCQLQARSQPVACDCEKKLYHDSDTEHTTAFITAKDRTEEQYNAHEIIPFHSSIIILVTQNMPVYTALIPADHTRTVFQPPRV